MFDNKLFWRAQHAVLVVLWIAAAALLLQGQLGHWAVLLAGVILVAHIAEIPLALHLLRDKNPAGGRVALQTLLFGYTWWLPARRGLFPVR